MGVIDPGGEVVFGILEGRRTLRSKTPDGVRQEVLWLGIDALRGVLVDARGRQ